MNISYGITEEKGLRATMEDEHAIYQDETRSFFSAEIYDGHGGRRPASIAAEMLTPAFLHSWKTETQKPARERRHESDILRDAYLMVDEYIVTQRLEAGTCAVQLYIIGERFMAANAGDSRIVIGCREGARLLTRDHKPDVSAERSRIESLGGHIRMLGVPRVEGILAISRALGDKCLKPFVSPEPRIAQGILGAENDLAVLACDGVWDVLSPDAVIKIARSREDPQDAASAIAQKALEEGSTDNITVIVVDLSGHTGLFANREMFVEKVYDKG
ncbi:MAG: PP2C family serine/threonine-protein phosphatase [Syntrophorhabdaceae bacterium]